MPTVIPLWCSRAPHGELLYAPWHNGGPCMCNGPLSPQDSSGPMDPVSPLWTHWGPCVCILHCHPHQAALRVGLAGKRVRISGSVLKSESIPQHGSHGVPVGIHGHPQDHIVAQEWPWLSWVRIPICVPLLRPAMQWQKHTQTRHTQQTHPKLYASILKIEVHRVEFASKQEELFSNFKLSHRGSIRKPPNVVTWVFALSKLLRTQSE
jgi:hypothetical protein